MHIACLLADEFEDSEFRTPYEGFRQAGHTVTVIGVVAGKKLTGHKEEESFVTNAAAEEARADIYDALFIPGGHSPDSLRANRSMVGFARAFAHKPIFAIGHGPQLLITADMVAGRSMTAWKTVQVDLANAGARVSDEAVVIDGSLVTSRQPPDLPAFVQACLSVLEARAAANAAFAE